MRIRTIKPEFFKHDILGALSPLSRILFIGLWCMADCAGRMEDRPKRIKVEVLPYDEVDIEELLASLAGVGLIVRYSVEGQALIELPTFERHQRISGKEADTSSRFPGMQKKKPGKRTGSNGEAMGKHPESLETEGKRKGKETDAEGEGFDQFWSSYPKKKDKESARKAFARADVGLDVILSAVERFKADPDWIKNDGQFIPYPATWLNGRRWEDEPTLPLLHPRPGIDANGRAHIYDAPRTI